MVLIFITIQAEGGADATSESIKKIILNFLQIVSLAANLPLQWPAAVDEFLSGLNVLASAGSTLLIPDCELTTMRTSEAFYMKQIGFTLIVPLIVCSCVLGWNLIFKCCRRRAKLSHAKKADYTILSIVLLLFIAYPMLVQLCLSMLKCPKVGQSSADRFLMADLQSRCFHGRHLLFFLALTVPQIILYVLGLPLVAVVLMWREPKRRVAFSYHFRIRYGLLFMGYRPERWWYESIIAVRKVTIVMTATFGETMMGRADLQAFTALAIVFCSIVIHLVAKPFDLEQADHAKLHMLEFMSLSICWFTFWGGLIFYLGPSVIPQSVKITMSICIVAAIFLFLLFATILFVKEYYADFKKQKKTRRDTVRAAEMSKEHLQLIRRFGGIHADPIEPEDGKEHTSELDLGKSRDINTSNTKVAPIQPL
jgi:hypothetical protein